MIQINEMYDVAIIGTGVAGISAALTLQLHNKTILWIGYKALSEKIRKAERIKNYPGLSAVSGETFCAALKDQIAEAGLQITEEQATGVYAMGESFTVLTNAGSYECRTVILATGVESAKTLSGESEYLGKGVSYCATCDGFLYKGKTVAVMSTSKEKEGEAEYLASLAGKLYYIPLYKDCGLQGGNIEIIHDRPTAIIGNKRVEKLSFRDRELPIEGIFFLKNAVSPAILVGGLKTENGHVVASRDTSTNIKGCFAAGDCTGAPYQYAKAAGEGNVAAHAVVAFLRNLQKEG